MEKYNNKTCCFSGYRIEKMPIRTNETALPDAFGDAIAHAVINAANAGYTRFFTGMSTGFDLWAAETVLRLRKELPIRLLCAIPFDQQAERYPAAWKALYNRCLMAADEVFALSRHYYAGCYAARNRYMVENSRRLICYFDGKAGGTAQTVRMARQKGLDIVNLADTQLQFWEGDF